MTESHEAQHALALGAAVIFAVLKALFDWFVVALAALLSALFMVKELLVFCAIMLVGIYVRLGRRPQ